MALPGAQWQHPEPEEQAPCPAAGRCLGAAGSSRSSRVGKYAELTIGIFISNDVDESAGADAVDVRVAAAAGRDAANDMCGKRQI